MKRRIWKLHHKWFGLITTLFLTLFCLSGIILNHRYLWRDLNVSRAVLPPAFRFHNWNQGMLQGECLYSSATDTTALLFGCTGVYSRSSGGITQEYNRGLPVGADRRAVSSMLQTPDRQLFLAAQYELFRLDSLGVWRAVPLPKPERERLTDLTSRADTLVVVGRDALYLATAPYRRFLRLELRPPENFSPSTSLFRTVWMLHSGELFGLPGRLAVDAVALILMFLAITGLLYWGLPLRITRRKRRAKSCQHSARWLKRLFNWHVSLGRWTIILTLFITLTGLSLRPPLLIPLVKIAVPTVPGTALRTPNVWHDQLRMLRYDTLMRSWLLSSGRGFYALSTLSAEPTQLRNAPPVSPMGLNVWERADSATWVVASFSGPFLWQPQYERILDYTSGEVIKPSAGPPFGRFAVQGYARGGERGVTLVGYTEGYQGIPMPHAYSTLPMPLWRLALEVHTGRIFSFLGLGTLVYPFFLGLAIAWALWTGYKLLRRPSRRPSPRRGEDDSSGTPDSPPAGA